MEQTFVSLHNKSCLGCGHLVENAREYHDSCHFTNGNAGCPAKKFTIGVGVDQERASQAIAEALYNEDASELLRLSTKLNKLNVKVSRSVMSKIFNKYALLNGISVNDVEDDEDAGEGTTEEVPVGAELDAAVESVIHLNEEAASVVAPEQEEASDAPTESTAKSSEDDEDEWVD